MAFYILKRLLWMLPTLVGIAFVTFLLMELTPGDAARRALEGSPGSVAAGGAVRRSENLKRMEERLGLRDPETGLKYSMGERFGRWLGRAARLDFAGEHGDTEQFRERLLTALPVSLLVNLLALLAAFAVALPLGGYIGMRTGGVQDRLVSALAFVQNGTPEFLIATLLVLVFGGGFFGEILPVVGLRSEGMAGAGASRPEQLWDLARHLFLPVGTLALGYGVIIFRFLRDSVARAALSDFVLALRGWGMNERSIRRRALRNGLSPVVTLLGTMLPTLVGGTVVVEYTFSLPGLGTLMLSAVNGRDFAMVMALTMLVGVVTLLSLLLSDVLHRVVDPRVELE